MDVASVRQRCTTTVFNQIDPDHEDNRHGNCSAYQSLQQGADDHVIRATANHELRQDEQCHDYSHEAVHNSTTSTKPGERPFLERPVQDRSHQFRLLIPATTLRTETSITKATNEKPQPGSNIRTSLVSIIECRCDGDNLGCKGVTAMEWRLTKRFLSAVQDDQQCDHRPQGAY